MSDADLVQRVRANKWTIAVLTIGLLANLGLTRLGQAHRLSWHEVNTIRGWKETIFGLILAQSGKALRRYEERSGDVEGGDREAGPGPGA